MRSPSAFFAASAIRKRLTVWKAVSPCFSFVCVLNVRGEAIVVGGGQYCDISIAATGGSSTGTVEHPEIARRPDAITSSAGNRHPRPLIRLNRFAQLICLGILNLLVLRQSFEHFVFEFHRPVALSQRIYIRTNYLPFINPLCDAVINGSDGPDTEDGNQDRWVKQEFEHPKNRHGMSPYLAKALGLDPAIKGQATENDASYSERYEDFVYPQTENLLRNPYASLCVEEHLIHIFE